MPSNGANTKRHPEQQKRVPPIKGKARRARRRIRSLVAFETDGNRVYRCRHGQNRQRKEQHQASGLAPRFFLAFEEVDRQRET